MLFFVSYASKMLMHRCPGSLGNLYYMGQNHATLITYAVFHFPNILYVCLKWYLYVVYFRDELYLGHGKKDVFKSFEKVVLGHEDSKRAMLPNTGLSVEQQVAALIDQATDPNILGRTWVGWEPWM